jgi:hypothetical protein
VSLEGARVLDNYDIVQKVGPLTATTETFAVSVTDGVLNLDLSALAADGGVDQAKISAIEILSARGSRTLAATAGRASAASPMSVYPNPSAGRFTLDYTAGKAQAATLILTDQLGRVVHQQKVSLLTGRNQVSMQMLNLPAGLYQLTMRTADGLRQSQKVSIQF